jgi:hypothetical protein
MMIAVLAVTDIHPTLKNTPRKLMMMACSPQVIMMTAKKMGSLYKPVRKCERESVNGTSEEATQVIEVVITMTARKMGPLYRPVQSKKE